MSSEQGLRVIEIGAAFLGGGGLTFIVTLLKRKWQKEDQKDEIMEELRKTNVKIDNLRDTFMSELKKDRKENEEYKAKQSRTRILQFNDELMRSVMHTKESFDDCISEIDFYEDFCKRNPDFPNFKAVAAIENIKAVYKKRLKEGDFLQ